MWATRHAQTRKKERRLRNEEESPTIPTSHPSLDTSTLDTLVLILPLRLHPYTASSGTRHSFEQLNAFRRYGTSFFEAPIKTNVHLGTHLQPHTKMDSMRSLNKSLPKTKRQPDVHQSFKNAALQLTNLYKSALADVDRARSDGYQEALDDLLTFLDKGNLGVGDGEGWQIRQWATERLDGPRHTNSDEDDENDMDDKPARSSSPIMERNLSPESTRNSDLHADATHRSGSAPPVQLEASVTEPEMSPLHQVFQFSAPQT